MQQKKVFSSGIDSDSAQEILGIGVDRYRLNCRVMSAENGNEGSVETTNGNTLVTFTLPAGTNKCIGTREDKIRKKVYYFVWNSLNSHRILEFDSLGNIITLVMAESVAAPYILNFQFDYLITGVNVVELDKNNHLLYWTDNYVDPNDTNVYNEPKKINIEKAIAYSAGDYVTGYKFPFEPLWAYRIKQPPLCCPEYTWSGIGDQTPVLVVDATSTVATFVQSGAAAPIPYDFDAASPGDGYNTSTYEWIAPSNKLINVLVSNTYQYAYPSIVVELYVNGAMVRSQIDGYDTLPITKNSEFTGVIVQAGDIVQVKVHCPTCGLTPLFLRIYEIPDQASLSINHLLNKLFQFKVKFVYDDFEESAWSPISNYVFPVTTNGGNSGQAIDLQDDKITIAVPTGSGIVKRIKIAGRNVDQTDFSLIADINKEQFGIGDDTIYDYIFTDFGGATPIEVNDSDKLFDFVPLHSQAQDFFDNRIGDGEVTEGFNPVSVDVRLTLDYEVLDTNPNTFYPAQSYLKSGGKYNFGIVYYDESGNRSGLTNSIPGKFDVENDGGKYGTILSIPFLTEESYGGPGSITPNLAMQYVPLVDTFIYNRPPAWATHYQIVRTKNQAMGRYIQFAADQIVGFDGAGATTFSTDATRLGIYINNITGAFKLENPNSHLVYDFAIGDRLRLIADVNYTTYSPFAPLLLPYSNSEIQAFLPYSDVVITNYDAGAGYIQVQRTDSLPFFNTAGTVLRPGCLFEIYQPNNVIDEDSAFTYEMGECWDLITDANGNLVHQGQLDQLIGTFSASTTSAFDVTLTVPIGHGFSIGNEVKVIGDNGFNVYGIVYGSSATQINIDYTGHTLFGTVTGAGEVIRGAKIRLEGGDTFRRLRNMPYIDTPVHRLYSYIEDAQVSDVFTSYAENIGRPNRVDDTVRQATHIANVRYSEQLIPETFINGLSSVFDTNFQEYNQNFGGIKKLYAEEQNLIMFQELKCSRIPVSQILYNDLSLQQTVGASSVVLSDQPIYYAGEYGIGNNPESFAVYGNAKYFIDVRRGAVLRLSVDGLTVISDTAKMHNYITDKCALVLKGATRVKIYGAWDKKFNEYVLSFETFKYFSGGTPPLTTVPGETLAFNEQYNVWSTFYSFIPDFLCSNGINIVSIKDGQFYTHNTNVIQNNFYGVQYTSQIWSVLNDNPSNVKVFEAVSEESNGVWEVYEITTPNGQLSNLIEDDFQMKENNQYAALWMDENTPNVVNPLIEGDVMRDRTFLCKFRYNGTNYNRMFALNYIYVISNLHNK